MPSQNTTQPTFIALPKKAKDIAGQTFGRLTALGPISRTPNRQIMWLCQCDCGNTTTVRSNHLLAGATVSCGCVHRESTINRNTTHSMCGTRMYTIWKGIIQRCCNSSSENYSGYGGRGIQIFPEWRNSFDAFHDHVRRLPHFSEEGYTIDRIDNNGNYEPGNLKWSTQTEQARNTRSNRLLTFDGRTQCLSAWEDEMGLRKGQLWERLHRGWPTERALIRHIRHRW